jgi:prepilin-type N-terminal cleavage/methylation domain-containing protein
MAQVPVKTAQGGFTLIEVLIALVLTAIAIMGIIALYITETKASGFSRHTTEAAVLVQDKVELLRTEGPAANIALTTEPNINERGTAASGIFTRSYSETLLAGWAEITVTVTWNDDGINHTITVKARRNL